MNTRRKFIKKSALATLGAVILPKFFTEDIQAQPLSPLNYKPEPHLWNDDEINISWLGHSTVLINFYGKWILTDPALFERVGIYFLGTSFGPSRLTPPALKVDELPKPDLILLSHAHMDHTDVPTLKAITKRFPNEIDVVVAHLTADVIDDMPWKSINVLDWQEELKLPDFRIKAFEVRHFGWRFPWEKDRSRGHFKDGRSYNAYVIERNGKKILFGGDTAKTDKLRAAKDENIDIAIMPIGAYNPWIQAHCNPEEALTMANEINAKHFIPIHTKTFNQSSEPFEEAIQWMNKAASKMNIKIGLDQIGQTFNLA